MHASLALPALTRPPPPPPPYTLPTCIAWPPCPRPPGTHGSWPHGPHALNLDPGSSSWPQSCRSLRHSAHSARSMAPCPRPPGTHGSWPHDPTWPRRHFFRGCITGSMSHMAATTHTPSPSMHPSHGPWPHHAPIR